MILLKGGVVVDTEAMTEGIKDLLIDDDGILTVYESIDNEYPEYKTIPELSIFDCEGLVIGPGLVDAHAHFRDPGFEYKEDIITGSRAAARGGYTDVVLMANTDPTVDNVDTLKYVLDKGATTDIRVHSCASVTKKLKGDVLVDFQELLEAGACGFTDDGRPIMDEDVLSKAMEESADKGFVISLHEENPKYIENNGINRGAASRYFNIGGSDRQAEISMIERDIECALRTGAHINIQHISTKEGVELVRAAKKDKNGDRIHAEATPHHIALTEEATKEYGTNAKMNPPLRTEEDRRAVIEGILDGTIEMIATDHAPHADYEKELSVIEAPSGIIGLETSFKVAHKILCSENKMSFLQLFCKMSKSPSEIFGLDAGKLAIDRRANLVVFDPYKIQNASVFESKSSNTPFKDMPITGDVVMTVCNGKIVFQGMKKPEVVNRKKYHKKHKAMGTIIRNEPIATDIFSITVATELNKNVIPGQFVGVYTNDSSKLLPRPISICEVLPKEGAIRLVYRVAGKGTEDFSRMHCDETVALLGVLGNGYPMDKLKGKKVVIMAGGIGIPPMLQLAKELSAEENTTVTSILGYRNSEDFLADEFLSYSNVYIATEDGSIGTQGNVLDSLKERFIVPDVICACGPMPMLKAVSEFAEEIGVEAYISLEERMACGVGACLGCIAKTKQKDHHSNVNNARICTDGPVFNSKEVAF